MKRKHEVYNKEHLNEKYEQGIWSVAKTTKRDSKWRKYWDNELNEKGYKPKMKTHKDQQMDWASMK